MFAADSAAAEAPWPELGRRFPEADRWTVPPFLLHVFPETWRPWIEAHAQSSTCTDYIAQGLLAAVSAVCGSRFVVDVTPHWREPLVLWQALVGAPSQDARPGGGPPAARQREVPPDRLAEPARPAKRDEDGSDLTAWLIHRGVSLWYDDLDSGFAELSRARGDRSLVVAAWTGNLSQGDDDAVEVGMDVTRWRLSIFGTFQADRLVETLSAIGDGLSSRILYCWPVPRLEARVETRAADEGTDGDGVRPLLQRLVDLPGTSSASPACSA
jgi:hypothetical protein